MKKRCRVLWVLLLALTMCFAAAEETEPTVYTSGDYEYILLADGTAKIKYYTGSADELTVPDALDGYSVSSIGDYAFAICDGLESITLPEGLTSFGKDVFFNSPEDMLFTVVRNSWAAKWCMENGKNYTCIDSPD